MTMHRKDTPVKNIHCWVLSHVWAANYLNEKEYRPVVLKTNPGGYPQCQSDRSIKRLSIWKTSLYSSSLKTRDRGCGGSRTPRTKRDEPLKDVVFGIDFGRYQREMGCGDCHTREPIILRFSNLKPD
ncbi:hypothetical protein TNCV_2357871 [Trichonephila clavipes]|nr:hypothetical protein TNCV_2357871 [Trichonephila clavipes]